MIGLIVRVVLPRVSPVLRRWLLEERVGVVAAVRYEAAALPPVGVGGAGGGGGDDGGKAALGHAVGAVARGEILHGGGGEAGERDSRVCGVSRVLSGE